MGEVIVGIIIIYKIISTGSRIDVMQMNNSQTFLSTVKNFHFTEIDKKERYFIFVGEFFHDLPAQSIFRYSVAQGLKN